MKRIVFVTSAQPSANPRLIKELKWIYNLDLTITVIYVPISPWADAFDTELQHEFKNINWICAASPYGKNSIIHYWARFRRKAWHLIAQLSNGKIFTGAKGLTLFSQELTKCTLKYPADVYIGHNLGALPAVVKAAHQFEAKSCFDLEDFHSGEMAVGSIEQQMVQQLESAYLHRITGLTVSSPLINQFYQEEYPALRFLTITNVFPFQERLTDITVGAKNDRSIKLIWFSQFVGKERGIETILEAMGKCSHLIIQLTLIGNCSDKLRNYFIGLAHENNVDESSIIFTSAINEKKLMEVVSQQDIGMAVEIDTRLNNTICWSNKLFFYPSVGIPIIASATEGQQLFIKTYPDAGSVFPIANADQLAKHLQHYAENKDLLLKKKESLKKYFRLLFESEGEKWRAYIRDVLSK